VVRELGSVLSSAKISLYAGIFSSFKKEKGKPAGKIVKDKETFLYPRFLRKRGDLEENRRFSSI